MKRQTWQKMVSEPENEKMIYGNKNKKGKSCFTQVWNTMDKGERAQITMKLQSLQDCSCLVMVLDRSFSSMVEKQQLVRHLRGTCTW